jgi:DNA polymerase III sliding clamp (beta) subunit (PCNA family)
MAENQAKIKKLLIKSDVLWRALEIIKQFISQNPPLPILDNAFFFNVSQKKIEIIGYDLVNFAKVTFPVQTSDEFCGLLQFDKLHKLLDPKLLPPQPLSIALDTETYVLEVNYQRGKTKSGSEKCDEYPNLPKIEEKKYLGVVDAKNLREKIRKTPVFKSYEDYKNFVSEKHLQLIALPKNIDRKLPPRGVFSMSVSSDFLILEGLLENLYQTELYFRRFQGLRETLEKEEIEALKNSPKKDMMLLVEDVLEEAKKIVPENKKNTQKTPKKHQESTFQEEKTLETVNAVFEKAKKLIIQYDRHIDYYSILTAYNLTKLRKISSLKKS